MKLLAKEIPQKKIIIINRTNLKKNEKNKFFLSMYFSYPFFIKFYYFYSAIVALKFKLSRKRSRILISIK